jgi:hypothetical protein
LGFDAETSKQFLMFIGLIKVGHSRNPTATIVVKSEWDKFLVEERLENLTEAVNQASIRGQRHFFINLGEKKMLYHRPIEEFNGKIEKKVFAGYIST